jgi:hypothetical protein
MSKSTNKKRPHWSRARDLASANLGQRWLGLQPTRGYARVRLPLPLHEPRGSVPAPAVPRRVLVLAGAVFWDSSKRGTYRK